MERITLESDRSSIIDAERGRMITKLLKNIFVPLLAKIQNLEYRLGLIADYVVETGTDGIWTYEKWESGKAVCWGRHTQTHSVTTQWGSWYYASSNSYYFVYPTGLFLTEPLIFTSMDSTNTCSIGCIGGNGNEGTKDRSPAITFFRATSNTGTIETFIKAIGKWK